MKIFYALIAPPDDTSQEMVSVIFDLTVAGLEKSLAELTDDSFVIEQGWAEVSP